MAVQQPWEPDERARSIRRRVTLTAALTGLAVAGAGSTAIMAGWGKPGPWLQSAGDDPLPGDAGLTKAERLYSAARGRTIELVTTLPSMKPPDGLPVCVVLHGIRADARSTLSYGLGNSLVADAVSGRVVPYGLAAVDGGDSYWQEARLGDDPMAMLLEELPQWLRQRGLGGRDGKPFACAGVSMGAFGALLYARRRSERSEPLDAAAAIAPALITSWSTMRERRVFSSPADWAAADPLRHPKALRGVRVGIWCGTDDPFVDGARKYIRRAAPAVGYLGPGGHNGQFINAVATDVVRFIGAGLNAV